MVAPLVILDRDGVLNRDSVDFVKSAAEWQPLPGSMEAIGLLTQAGFKVCVASNQSGIGRGLFSRAALYAMHRKLRRLAAAEGGSIDRIVVCPHHPGVGCECRKPRPGLLLRLARMLKVSLQGVPVVGDSLRDLDAARAAGARPVLVLTGNGMKTSTELAARGESVETYPDLLGFVRVLLNENGLQVTSSCK